jgi:hypothetical protein
MRLLRPRFKLTDADPSVVAFFFDQYTQLMMHGKDRTDEAMKGYLFDVITQLGVPESVPLPEPEPELVPEEKQLPIIVRRRHGC